MKRDRDAAIVAAFVKGLPLKQIGAEFGVSHEGVRQIALRMLGEEGARTVKARHTAERRRARDVTHTCACGARKTRRAIRCQTCDHDHRAAHHGRNRWNHAKVIAAARLWADMYGTAPSAISWNPAQLRAQGYLTRVAVFEAGTWPHTTTVQRMFGSWSAMITAAGLTPARGGATGHGKQPGTTGE